LPLTKQHTLRCEHPRLGYELLRTRNPDALMVNHVALEHHERQDGRGYPCGLRGTNKIERATRDPNNIKLIAEITTVADVYDILSAEKLDRPALTPQQIANTMRRLTGTFLNKEITHLFLAMLSSLPKGIGVIFGSGRYAGHKGIVIQDNQRQPKRPLVRLLFDAQGERITPVEVDTAREPMLNIEATLSL
jgi:HD-GYP domain-containing protein (c-di-GMP phosphodiesterase class II)